MATIPPEVQKFFDDQRRHQRFYEQAAQTQKTLRQTTSTLGDAFGRLVQRGMVVSETEAVSEELLQSSRAFLITTEPWWKYWLCCRCLPPWWFEACGFWR
jgi:hypothetical protein